MTRLRPVRRSSRAAGESGFSYVEVLLTVLLLSLVVGGILPLLTGGEESYEELRRRQEMIQNARVALDKFLRELRVAESFRVLSPATIRFTLFWGDGSGASPTAEYVLNGATGDLEYRWSADWDYRRQITVTAADAVAAGYAVGLTFNHAALVVAGKSLASGNDVRVRYLNGTEMVELDRVLDQTCVLSIPATPCWNRANTTIWFRLPAAFVSGASSTNYYLYYGNLNALAPPANGDNVFLDYENGSTIGGWTRRDGCAGTHTASADGFVFQTNSGNNCYRQFSKSIGTHDGVEIFWGFRSGTPGNPAANDRHMPGMGARFSDTGAGYIVSPGEDSNRRLRIRQMSSWTTAVSTWETARNAGLYRVTPGINYYGRFSVVGTAPAVLRAKFWPVGSAEDVGSWMLTGEDPTPLLSGLHYTQVDGHDAPQDHRHRTLIIRPRVTNEPLLTYGTETSGTRSDALESLAGPFRSLSVTCYDIEGNVVDCSPATPVRSVQVTLVVMDPSGRIPDITVTGRTFRQTP